MSVVVSRHQPSIPASAWMVVVLASLLVLSVGWWIAQQFPPVYSTEYKPAVEVRVRPSTSLAQSGTEANNEVQPERIYDWTEPEKDLKAPVRQSENIVKEPERTVLVYGEQPLKPEAKTESEPQAAMATPDKDANERIVPPPVRIKPEPPAESQIVRGDKLWKSPVNATVSSDEVNLTPSGETVNGREVYTLSGESEPTVLFMETSPGSGQYEVYRPAG